ncbi:MAG: DUF302 domain-containing protein [Spirochaetaceae bacterium]|nr:MAG: DUF302 domain-containing protein [Spirochaetaceae bacterium]
MSKKTLLVGVGALVLGIVLTGLIGFFSLPGMMMLEDESPHSFLETVNVFEDAVSEAGWSVLQVHDMQSILAAHGHDVEAVRIYELCSSRYSAEILKEDDARLISPLMPCRVSIYEKSDGTTYIARMNSILMAKPFGGVIARVMDQAAVDTEQVIDAVLNGTIATATR